MRFGWAIVSVLTIGLLHADTASAQILNFNVGQFFVRGEDGRVDGDVLNENIETFVFEIKDFNGVSVGAEYLFPIGEFLEAGAGVQFSTRTVPTFYDFYERPDGSLIEQEIKLRIVPITGTIRVLPLGRSNPFQPYVGGGIGIYSWRYSETGDFIDFSRAGLPIFRESYVADDTDLGAVAVFGARYAADRFVVGGELRYQKAEGDLNTEDFFGPKIDLGGFHLSATFGIRF